ncbi:MULTISPECIES: hypothetical protein [Gammaproteobacteria]|uniref:Uncharacterized protein n=1 Tax=Alloalcanivorax xenomutans TaxID=1094342 RepID=A0A9Q3ZG21_9GAMM|nr:MULTISPECIES: hypothetical protein [Gammaproteobacteria]ARB47013.1 hypothetical protein P40_17675 [Alloalcanivorax xenomutans]MCE7510391.1 hypothetical protein [Alloalcanivorax xenomutans]WOA33393.1 hypothetical protein RVY87_09970 [Alloalcanivorax xenomutans]WOD27698.1 hypothetical protein RYH70_16960 [Alloalcanivorax xenomutans]HIO99709.1 hypothetical protein [Marinobacter salarius]
MKKSVSLLAACGVVAASVVLIAVWGGSMSDEVSPVYDAAELRKAIDFHEEELRQLFPTLQGIGTDAEQGSVVLTIRSETGIMGENAMKDEAEALLGVPVRLRLLPVELRRRSPAQ